MDIYNELKNRFDNHQNQEKAIAMAKYMRNLFKFYGIDTTNRRKLYQDIIKEVKKQKVIDWELLNKCYDDEHREFQYFVCDYLLAMKKFLKFEDLDKIKVFIIKKSWWDTIDVLCKVIGFISLDDNRVKTILLEYSKSDNLWLRRVAIEHQLGFKDQMDTKLLSDIISNNFDDNEFFINKAIGWILRDYSKTNPNWVRCFIKEHQSQLSTLSIKEASKYL